MLRTIALILVIALIFSIDDVDAKRGGKKKKKASSAGFPQPPSRDAYQEMANFVSAGEAALKQSNIPLALELFQKASDEVPHEPRPHFKRAIALMAADASDESLEAFEKSWEQFEQRVKDPNIREKDEDGSLRHDILNNMALLLSHRDRFKEAQAKMKMSHEGQAVPKSYSNYVSLSQALCEWSEWDDMISKIEGFIGDPQCFISPSAALIIPFNVSGIISSARHVAHVSDLRAMKEKKQPNLPMHPPLKTPTSPLRIGFLANVLFGTALSRSLAAVFTQIVKGAPFFVFEINAGDSSYPDWSLIKSHLGDRLVTCNKLSPAEVAVEINKRQIRALISLEGLAITMYETNKPPAHTVLAYRPAPIVYQYPLLFPASNYDRISSFIFTDRVASPPEFESHFFEKFLYFPKSFAVSSYDFLSVRPRPDKDTIREKHGFKTAAADGKNPEKIFSSFNSQAKLTPEFMSVWLQALSDVPNSKLWLFSVRPVSVENIKEWASARGVDDKLISNSSFVSFGEHIDRIVAADVHLDTRINGIATGIDMLWRQIPFVTLAGDKMSERTCASIAVASGLPQYISRSLSDYKSLASTLARKPFPAPALHNTGIFNPSRFAADLVRLLRLSYETNYGGSVTTTHIILNE